MTLHDIADHNLSRARGKLFLGGRENFSSPRPKKKEKRGQKTKNKDDDLKRLSEAKVSRVTLRIVHTCDITHHSYV